MCGPGYYNAPGSAPTAACQECTLGSYCPGHEQPAPLVACPAGLTTLIAGASAADQCMTAPGFGFDAASEAAYPCEAGTFSKGKSRERCKQCGRGLTTNVTGASSFASCGESMGGIMCWGVLGGCKTQIKCCRGAFDWHKMFCMVECSSGFEGVSMGVMHCEFEMQGSGHSS